jgi:putative ABC transport system permease protein
MSSRWKKVMADFWSNKTRTILMIATITVGVFAIGFVQTTGLKMAEDMENDYQPSNPAEIVIYGWPMDDDTVDLISQATGVAGVEGRSQTSVQWIGENEKKVAIAVEAIDSPASVRIGKLKPANQTDTALPELGEHQILLERSSSSFNFTPGQLLSVEMPNGKIRKVEFGGYVHDATAIPFTFMGALTGYVTPDTLVWLGGSQTYDQLKVSVDKNPTDIEYVTSVGETVSKVLKDAGIEVYYVSIYNPGHHFAWEIAKGSFLIFDVIGWLTVILSSVLVINTILSLMTQQKRQVGIMKAIGADDKQISGMYFVLLGLFGVIAFLIAVPLAAWLAYGNPMMTLLNINEGSFKIFPQVVVLQAIVAVLIPLVAGAVPLLNSIRQPAYESLSYQGIDNKKVAHPEEDRFSRWLAEFSRPVVISLRNAFRRKARMSLTVGTLVLAGAIFISVFNLWASFEKTMDQVQGYFLADIKISFSHGYRFEKVDQLAATVPGVESSEGWMLLNGELKPLSGETPTEIAFVAPPSDSTLIKPIITAGRWLIPGDENAVVIGNHLLKVRPDLKVGDWITVDLFGHETRWKIVGQYIMPGNVNPPLLYTNYEYLSRVVNQPGMIYELRVNTISHDPVSQDLAVAKIQKLFEDNKIQVTSMQTSSEWSTNQTNSTNMLIYFMMLMAVLIAIVGGVGLMGTMSINVLERTREIGVMRSIGADDGDIHRMVVIEGIFVSLMSWLISLVVAIPITILLTNGVGLAIFQAPIPVVYGLAGPLAWLAGTILLALLASLTPANRATRLTIRDALAYE